MDNFVLRNEKILSREKTALLVIDIQERILGVMQSPEEVVSNTLKLIRGFKVLDLPIFHTEQYPKGLGLTVKEIAEELSGLEPVQKLSFSCSGAGELFPTLKLKNISQLVVCGIESHVCVQQTVLDLLANDFQVDVAADAVSSRKDKDYRISLERMARNGAEVTTTESILFELLNVCGTDEFKSISKIVK
ncbi:MAG: hydrolase [Bacillota bacterium]